MVHLGIAGAGKINHTFMGATLKTPGFRLEAVYSGFVEEDREFARSYGADRIYTSLKELGNDNDAGAVYITGPNSSHCGQSICMPNHSKHILCEKPIASAAGESESMTETAGIDGKILLEAMRPIFDPGLAKIEELLLKVGRIRGAVLQYCQHSSRYDAFKKGIIENAFSPVLSSVTLMDTDVYCIHPMVLLSGKPDRVTVSSTFLHDHTEGTGIMLMDYGTTVGEARYSKITCSSQFSKVQDKGGAMLI